MVIYSQCFLVLIDVFWSGKKSPSRLLLAQRAGLSLLAILHKGSGILDTANATSNDFSYLCSSMIVNILSFFPGPSAHTTHRIPGSVDSDLYTFDTTLQRFIPRYDPSTRILILQSHAVESCQPSTFLS